MMKHSHELLYPQLVISKYTWICVGANRPAIWCLLHDCTVPGTERNRDYLDHVKGSLPAEMWDLMQSAASLAPVYLQSNVVQGSYLTPSFCVDYLPCAHGGAKHSPP